VAGHVGIFDRLVGRRVGGRAGRRSHARLEADALTPGSAGAVMVSYALADGFVIAPDGMVAPIVQVAVPDSVKLDGAVLTDHKKLARNDFLHAPYELAMKQPTQRIAFTVQSPPAADAHIGLNFIVYLRTPTGDARFVRRRLEVPLKLPARDVTGQSRVGADAAPSPWGTGQFLDIGDRADDFTLPRRTVRGCDCPTFAARRT
jgi:hypothetical protein